MRRASGGRPLRLACLPPASDVEAMRWGPILSHVTCPPGVEQGRPDAMQPEPVQRQGPWPVAAATVQSDKLATAQEVQNPNSDSAREASRTRCQTHGPAEPTAAQTMQKKKNLGTDFPMQSKERERSRRRQGKHLHRQCTRGENFCRHALLCTQLLLVWIHHSVWRRHPDTERVASCPVGREARSPCVQDLRGQEGVRLHSSASHLGRHKSQVAPFARCVTRYVVRAGDKWATKSFADYTWGTGRLSLSSWARRRPSTAPQKEGC